VLSPNLRISAYSCRFIASVNSHNITIAPIFASFQKFLSGFLIESLHKVSRRNCITKQNPCLQLSKRSTFFPFFLHVCNVSDEEHSRFPHFHRRSRRGCSWCCLGGRSAGHFDRIVSLVPRKVCTDVPESLQPFERMGRVIKKEKLSTP
jgi:hypothetical protein